MSDTSISNVMAIRAEVIARSRALREAQPTAPPGVTPTAPVSNFADTLNAVVAKVNATSISVFNGNTFVYGAWMVERSRATA